MSILKKSKLKSEFNIDFTTKIILRDGSHTHFRTTEFAQA